MLGLDAGTTSTKVVVAGVDGVVRSVHRAGYLLGTPRPGHAELAAGDLVAAAPRALALAAASLRSAGDVPVAVSLAGAMHGLVLLDGAGEASTPLLTWADTRAGAQARRLREHGRAPGLHARTGTPVHPMSPLVKLLWWREHRPELLRAAARVGGVKELLVGALVGQVRRTELSSASSTGLFDLDAGRWDPEAVELAGLRPDQLDEVAPTTSVVGGLRPDVAAACGLPAGLPVVHGATDGPLANLGTGALSPTTVAVSLGTSGAVRVVRQRPGPDPAGRLFRYALTEDAWVVGGAVSNAGSALAWLQQLLGGTPEQLLAAAARVPAGADGLTALPHLLGERGPWWRDDLSGALLGLRQDHGPEAVVRAVLEGVCQQLALVLADLGPGPRRVRVTGGGAAAPLWRQVLADACDLPVHLADPSGGTGLGACLLGWLALGGLPDLATAAALPGVGEATAPDPGAAAGMAARRPWVERVALVLADLPPPDPPREGPPGHHPAG